MSSNKKEKQKRQQEICQNFGRPFGCAAMLFGSAVTVFQAFFAGKNNGSS